VLKIWISKYLILAFIRERMLKDCVKVLQNFRLSMLREFDNSIKALMTLVEVIHWKMLQYAFAFVCMAVTSISIVYSLDVSLATCNLTPTHAPPP